MMVKMGTIKGRMNPKGTAKKRVASLIRATLAGDTMGQPVELPEGMWERVANKARELWELRGRREGHDLQDWFDAEVIVMEEIHEARE